MEKMPDANSVPVIDTFVAIGDSFTEGLEDQVPGGRFRGWADMVAAALAAQRPGFRYANLAIRGKLLGEVVAEQLPSAVELAPDLVSLAAGGNDILRGSDVDTLAADFEPAVAKLQAAGCRVLIFTGFDPRMFPVIRLLRGRIAAYNMHLRGIADDYGCDLVDLWSMRALKDPRAWSPDRLHLTTQGHQRVAQRACELLGIPLPADWPAPPPPAPLPAPAPDRSTRFSSLRLSSPQLSSPWLAARRQDARWVREYAGPWLRRRLTGASSGDNVPPKRPDLLPL
jgi:lysophospholipase L1-like esterase